MIWSIYIGREFIKFDCGDSCYQVIDKVSNATGLPRIHMWAKPLVEKKKIIIKKKKKSLIK